MLTIAKFEPTVTTWTPTWTGLTVGSSVQTAEYVRLGEWIEFWVKLVTGASFALSGPILNLPVPAATGFNGPPLIDCVYTDASPLTYYRGGADGIVAGIAGALTIFTTSGTFSTNNGLSATVPFTWGTGGDVIQVTGRYRTAT